MGEFEFIQQYCTKLGIQDESVLVGVGDDAAVIDVPTTHSLLVSTDTMNLNQHFYADADPTHLAHKLIHSNASDIAAMGGQPRWATVALSLSEMEPVWLQQFSDALNQQAQELAIAVVGGDTTKGSLSMTLTIMGTVPRGQALLRSGAQPDDLICVSGELGGAAAGLKILQAAKKLGGADGWQPPLDNRSNQALIECLHRPTAQVAIGQSLLGFASSCIDTSDGLAGDLHHILRASRVNAHLDWQNIPVHRALSEKSSLSVDELKAMVLYGGEDYQLVFTINSAAYSEWQQRYPQLAQQVNQVGRIEQSLASLAESSEPSLLLLDDHSSTRLDPYAYQHF